MIAVDVLRKALELDDVTESLKVPSPGVKVQKLENKWLRQGYGLEDDLDEVGSG